MDALAEKLGYQFRDQDLLVQSLTHPSMSAEQREAVEDNQRLEFLGDAVLQVILTEHLYRILPDQAGLGTSRWRTRSRSARQLHQRTSLAM